MIGKKSIMKNHDEEGEEWQVPSLEKTLEKMKQNSFQYASAGDVRRLIKEIETAKSRGAVAKGTVSGLGGGQFNKPQDKQ